MPRQLQDQQNLSNDILSSFISDDEDQDQLGLGNDVSDDDDDDNDDTSLDTSRNDGNDDDDDNDDDNSTQQRRPTGDVDDNEDEDSKQDRFSFKEDRAGNFIDRDGRIIFRAGKQRDLFVKLKKRWLAEEKAKKALEARFGETVTAAQQLLQRYKDLRDKKTEFDNKGLTEPEIKQAAEFAVMMKIDPKAAVRKILTMLHMNGTDLKDIGVSGPVDAAEVARIIEQRAQPKQETEEEKARKEAQSFLDRHPTAQRYTGVIAEAKRRYPHMSLDEIWFQLVLHAQKKQKEKSGKDNKRQPDNRQQQRPSPVSARNGRREEDHSDVRGRKLSLAAVDPSQSFSQIGRDLLRDLKDIEGR